MSTFFRTRQNSKLQNRLKTLFDNTADLIAIYDVEKNSYLINRAGLQMLGYNANSENVIINASHFTAQEWASVVLPALEETYNNDYWQGSLTFLNCANEPISTWTQFISHKNTKGKTDYILYIAKDLRPVKKLEDIIKQNEARYRLLFEYNPQPMWIYDMDTLCIIEVNHSAMRVYGYTKDEFIGMHLKHLRPVENMEADMAYIKNNNRLYDHAPNRKHITKSGKIMDVDILSYQFTLDGRRVRLVSVNDVSELRQSEEKLKAYNYELLKKNELLDQYVYIISHNIRGPVATLLGLINVLQFESFPERLQTVVENMQQSALHLDEVITDLNKILSVRTNVQEVREPIYLPEIIESVKQQLYQSISISNTKILIKLDAEIITGVKSYINSIFYNLISNAIKYKHPERNPEIVIESSTDTTMVIMSVKDNGIGIDLSKHKTKMFGLYKRFHHHVEGKGLGLHLVKTCVEAMNGTIEVSSEPNIGTTFIINLPIE